MEKNDIGVLIGTVISLILLICGVSIHRWPCGLVKVGVFSGCLINHDDKYLVIGILLIIAIILIAFELIAVILDLTIGDAWTGITALVCACIGAVLALAAMLYYYIEINSSISPILSTIGMAFAVAVAIFMVMQKISC
ncbi:unnamed protein product [Dibothriocephalus latus]|uniref:Uncharacterized protein n=1 Tax=Dibothriocephalus latus TaxID=60516 RepID=A0A3P6U7D0_DIBLA|nr:unnamed protein product [Dibothriocephalus latus]